MLKRNKSSVWKDRKLHKLCTTVNLKFACIKKVASVFFYFILAPSCPKYTNDYHRCAECILFWPTSHRLRFIFPLHWKLSSNASGFQNSNVRLRPELIRDGKKVYKMALLAQLFTRYTYVLLSFKLRFMNIILCRNP